VNIDLGTVGVRGLEPDSSVQAHIVIAIDVVGAPVEGSRKRLSGIELVFGASQLMMHALSGHRTSAKEIEELRRILDAYQGDDDGKAG